MTKSLGTNAYTLELFITQCDNLDFDRDLILKTYNMFHPSQELGETMVTLNRAMKHTFPSSHRPPSKGCQFVRAMSKHRLGFFSAALNPVSYTHLRAHET